jgi:tetratricopeptide (TPR) repeat protein
MEATHSEVRKHLERVLATRGFQRASRLGLFLRFIVEETLAGRGAQLKEYTIGTEVYGRSVSFDPRLDATIRVEAHKLRNRLEEYYCTTGAGDRVRILLRKASYVPDFCFAQDADATSASELCSRGFQLLALRTPEALERAYSCLWRAVVEYPDFSESYHGLAAYYFIAGGAELLPPSEAWPRARMALAQAQCVGKMGAAAQLIRGGLAALAGNGDSAEKISRHAVQRYPSDPDAHFFYSGVLSAQERHVESIEHMRMATILANKIAPGSSNALLCDAHVSWALYHAHDYSSACEHLRERFGTKSTNIIVLYLRGKILSELGAYDEAIESLTRLSSAVPIPMSQAALGYAYAKAGLRADAEAILEELLSKGRTCYVSPVRTAAIHRALRRDSSFASDLEKAGQAYALLWSRVDPQLS